MVKFKKTLYHRPAHLTLQIHISQEAFTLACDTHLASFVSTGVTISHFTHLIHCLQFESYQLELDLVIVHVFTIAIILILA